MTWVLYRQGNDRKRVSPWVGEEETCGISSSDAQMRLDEAAYLSSHLTDELTTAAGDSKSPL